MFEIELKFQVPAATRAAVRRAVATTTAREQRLRARYLDTADGRLAGARAALRLRDEGAHWVQTFKAEGAHPLERLEHEVRLPAAEQPPDPDLARHARTPAGAALARALGLPEVAGDGRAQGLGVVFETDIRRLRRVLRLPGGARVELAFDEGVIRGGGRECAVCEVEFELLEGPVDALLAVAARWVRQHGLWLDVRSKAERGHLLAQGAWASPPATAQPPRLRKKQAPVQALQALLRSALDPMLRNASVLADATLEGRLDPIEYLHQCRVGLRRLRSLLRALPLPEGSPAAVRPDWEPRLAALSAPLGRQRDQDLRLHHWAPLLRAAGAPWVEGTAAPAEPVGELLRGTDFNLLVLELLGFVAQPQVLPEADGPGLKRWLREALQPLQRRVRRDLRAADLADDEALHALRKRIKRLRYGLQATADLWPRKTLAAQLAALGQAQSALGDLLDQTLAAAHHARLAGREPRAWWGAGWLQAGLPARRTAAAAALAALAQAPDALD